MRQLNTTDLDDMTYRRALERLREEYKADSESLAQSEAISIMSLEDIQDAKENGNIAENEKYFPGSESLHI